MRSGWGEGGVTDEKGGGPGKGGSGPPDPPLWTRLWVNSFEMNNIWNTFNAPTVPFYCIHKITFLLSFRSQKHTLCIIQYSVSNSRVFYFLLEVHNLKIHRDMTIYTFYNYYTTGVQ